MHFDFAALLVLLTFLTGIIWAVDAMLFAPRRRKMLTAGGPSVEVEDDSEKPRTEPLVVEYSRSFFPVILIVLVVRSFLGEPFRIPSSSMVPTLLIGDLILVNKFAYGLRLPVTNTKILDLGGPERGDVVVFRFPPDQSQDYIKRVIGLPGDSVEYRDRELYINGELVEREFIGPYIPPDGKAEPNTILGTEELGSVQHNLLHDPADLRHPRYRNARWVVPEGQYFVMGDNRDNSLDSRRWGFVPEENLVGEAVLIWMRLSLSNWGRIGTVIN